MKRLAILLLAAAACLSAWGQGRVAVGFYNVENLFDTLPNPFADDGDFTPGGANRWDTERYLHKINNISRVLDDMALDVVGLAEVENEAVLRDLVSRTNTDYAYIHITDNDSRGLEQALLYKGDRFFPGRARLMPSAAGRGFLYVPGTLAGRRVDLIVVHMPSNLNSAKTREKAMRSLRTFVDSLRVADPAARPVVMGDMNASPRDGLMRRQMGSGRDALSAFLYHPFVVEARKGVGTYAYRGRWQLFDHIILSAAFLGGGDMQYLSCGVFVRDYMLSDEARPGRGYPLRTFSSGRYTGGFSDHLPVYVYFSFKP